MRKAQTKKAKTGDRPREIGIRTYRLDGRFTQMEMAAKLGIDRSTLAAIESGCKPIGKGLARLIGEFTGQSVGAVIDEWEEMYGETAKHRRSA